MAYIVSLGVLMHGSITPLMTKTVVVNVIFGSMTGLVCRLIQNWFVYNALAIILVYGTYTGS